jgi:acetyl esterase/lipase
MNVPVGYVLSVVVAAIPTWFAVAPRRGPWILGRLSFRLGLAINELPFVGLAWLFVSTLLAAVQGDLASPAAWTACGAAVLTSAGLVIVARRGLLAGSAVENALAEALGDVPGRPRGLPLARIVFRPFAVRRRDVERVADIAYGPAGKRNRLDVYRHRSRPQGGPVLVYFHGGGFVGGRKDKEARPLLYRLASQGWVCVSANYRLRPDAGFPDHLVDAKKVIAWAREHGNEYGADPSALFAAGSSAGGHLASMAALTPCDPAFQPGFETADTSVSGAISLYGYHGGLDGEVGSPSSPVSYLRPDAPPFFVAHGTADTLVPVEDTRLFVDRLRDVSANPVVYAELPGAQHSFDLFHSLRFEAVVNGIEAFTAQVRARAAKPFC